MRLEIEVEEQCTAEDRRRSKVIYEREFLLSMKELAVCTRLPTGIESSSFCELLSTVSDSDGDSQALDGISDNNSVEKQIHSPNYNFSDIWKHDILSYCPPKPPGCASSILDPMAQKNDAFQLPKSKNPYRPPHCYKAGNAKFEASPITRETNPIVKTSCGNQVDANPEKYNIAQQQEIKDSNHPVTAETNRIANLSSSDDLSNKFSGSAKSSGKASNCFKASPARRVDLLDRHADKTSDEHCRMITDQHVGVTLEDKSFGSSTDDLEKAASLPFSTSCEDSGSPLLQIEGSTGNDEPNQVLQPIPEIKKLNTYKSIFPAQRGPLYMETCGIPVICEGGNLSSSVIDEHGMSESDHYDLLSWTLSESLDLDEIEEDQFTFDKFWAEISAILRAEQELECISLATHKAVVDSDFQICFPDEDSLISIDYPTTTKSDASKDAVDSEVDICLPSEDSLISIDYLTQTQSSNSHTADNYTGVTDSEAEISLPEEDSLITVEDLIAPLRSKSTGREHLAEANLLKSNSEVNTSKKTAGLDIAPHSDERSSVAREKHPPFIKTAGSETWRKLHTSQSHSQNLGTGFSSQKGPHARFMDPKRNPDLHCNSCTGAKPVHSWRTTPAMPTNIDCVVQYSVPEQPTNFSQQESGIPGCSGLNRVGMLTPGPPPFPVPMRLYPPVAAEFSDQIPFLPGGIR